MRSRGKRLTLIVASLAVIVVGVATWQAWRLWPQIVFRWRFEALGANAEGYQEYRHRQTGIVMVRLPGGTFPMGSPEDEPWRQSDEGPVHQVTLSPFLIGKFELTQGEWHAAMGDYPSKYDGTKDDDGNPVNPPDNRDRLPVESVSWDRVQEFGERMGLSLPTEAQWEYACRGGTQTAFFFDSAESCPKFGDVEECAQLPEADPYMWYCATSGKRTHEVGTKSANPFGLHDIHGNVDEWVEDVHDYAFYSTPEAARPDPLSTSGSEFRVHRGGCWYDCAWFCRSACRFRLGAGYCRVYLGFRAAYWPLP